MAVSIKCGTLNSPTATGNQSYSTVGFQPKLVIFNVSNQTTAGTAVNAVCSFGVATSSSQRHGSSVWSEDNQGNSSCEANTSATRCVRLVNEAGTTILSADLVSMDGSGFTLNWLSVDASAKIVNWIAFGADITVWCGQINTKITSTGNEAYTGVGFQPELVMFFKPHGLGSTTTAGGGVTAAPSFGWAASSTSRACIAGIDVHGQAAADSATYQRTDRCYAILTSTAGIGVVADFVSFDADGFTLNYGAVSTVRTVMAVAIAGVQAKSGSFNQRSGTGSQAVTGVGFQTKAVLFAGWGRVTNEAVATADMDQYFGWASGASEEGSTWWGSDDAADPTACDSGVSTTACVQTRTVGTGAVVALADMTSLDADGFTLNYGVADSTARQNLYLAIGEPSGAAPGPWIEAGIVAKGVQTLMITGLENGTSYDVRVKTRDTSGNTTSGNTPVAGTPVAAAVVAPQIRSPQRGAARASGILAAKRGRR